MAREARRRRAERAEGAHRWREAPGLARGSALGVLGREAQSWVLGAERESGWWPRSGRVCAERLELLGAVRGAKCVPSVESTI